MKNSKYTIIFSKIDSFYVVLRMCAAIYLIYFIFLVLRLVWFMFQDSSLYNSECLFPRYGEPMGVISFMGKNGVSFKNIVPSIFLENGKLIYLINTVIELSKNVVLGFILWKATSIFKNVLIDDRPYKNEIVKLLKTIAKVLILYGVLSKLLAPFALSAMGIAKWDIQLLDPFTLLIAGMIFCLSYVFEYGMELQKESDETL